MRVYNERETVKISEFNVARLTLLPSSQEQIDLLAITATMLGFNIMLLRPKRVKLSDYKHLISLQLIANGFAREQPVLYHSSRGVSFIPSAIIRSADRLCS